MKPFAKTAMIAAVAGLLVFGLVGCVVTPPPPGPPPGPAAMNPRWILRASAAGNVHRVRAILSRYPNAIRIRGSRGRLPIHLAAKNGHWRVVQVLLNRGTNPNWRERNPRRWTALHFAAKFNRVRVARVLLNRGAGVNRRDRTGRTPLRVARQFHRNAVWQVIRNRGGHY